MKSEKIPNGGCIREDVSRPVRYVLRKPLVFKFQPLYQRATAIEICGKDGVFDLAIMRGEFTFYLTLAY